MKRSFIFIGLSAGVLGMFLCSEMSVSGNGGSSETLNAQIVITDTLAGIAIDKDAERPFIAQVFAADYRPYEKNGFTETVDSRTAPATLSVPKAGVYNFLISLQNDNRACFMQQVSLLKGKTDTLQCTLSEKHAVSGHLVSSEAASVDEQYIVSIAGTPFVCATDDANSFSFDAVPAGSYTMTVQSASRRLFIAKTKYNFSTHDQEEETVLSVILP